MELQTPQSIYDARTLGPVKFTILGIAIRVKYGAADSSRLTLAAIIGILLNAILPHHIDFDIEQLAN